MNKSKIEKRLPEPQHSKEQKADATSVSPAFAKPTVVRSPNIVSTKKDAETGYTITNQSTNQTLDLDGQIVVYLGHRHLHMRATELVEIILKRADELAPKVGVRQQFARLNNKDEFIISYGVKLSDGEIEFEDD